MKVELIISDEFLEESATLKSNKLSENIQKAVNFLENLDKRDVIAVKKDDKTLFLNFDEIYMIKTEEGKMKVYSENKVFTTKKRLYELENILDDSFIRISKSAIVNINKIDYIAPSLKGMMFINLKNGLKDNISRNYLQNFKHRLGMK